MSMVSGSGACRMTLADLASRYGFELVPRFAQGVTVTSLADDVDSVIPGSLYVPSGAVNMERLERAVARGAYAALVPRALRGAGERLSIPLLLGDYRDGQVAAMADALTGAPAQALAMFACLGRDASSSERIARQLGEFLHMLGNPVGVLCASDTQSLDRYVDMRFPLGVLDVRRTLSVCLEDGASAMVIALDDDTVRRGALCAADIDVLGIEADTDAERATMDVRARRTYGYVMEERGRVVGRTAESDAFARQAADIEGGESWQTLSLVIAMAMAAGVRRSNIRSALRVSRELS